jgi:hypothetical protein
MTQREIDEMREAAKVLVRKIFGEYELYKKGDRYASILPEYPPKDSSQEETAAEVSGELLGRVQPPTG